jgi:Tol biopolymer transport system component
MSIRIILKLGMIIGLLALVLVMIVYSVAPILPSAGQLGYIAESRFYVLDVDRSINHLLLEDPEQPQWSPDGDQIAYINRTGPVPSDSLVISPMFEPGAQVLYPTQAQNGFVSHTPAWSPFNSQIAFTYTQAESEAMELVVVEPTAGVSQVENITTAIPEGALFTWTAADRLRYVSVDSGVVRLNELRLNETEPAVVREWSFPTMSVRQAALSADGTRFILPAIVPRDLNFELYLFDVESDEVLNLTNRSLFNDTNPAWSPDEQHILFRSLTDSGQYLMMMKPDGSDQQTIFHIGEGLFSHVNWSPDGKQVSYVLNQSGRKRLCIFRTADKTVTCPARNVERAMWRPNT